MVKTLVSESTVIGSRLVGFANFNILFRKHGIGNQHILPNGYILQKMMMMTVD